MKTAHKVTILLFLVVCSCSSNIESKNAYLKRFDNFISRTDSNYLNYKENDWIISENEYNMLSKTEFEKFIDKLSEEEVAHINVLRGRYVGVKAKYKAHKANVWLNNQTSKAKGFIKAITGN